ncbi:adenylyl-sulfate kinase [Thermodesulfobacterium hveragerdense]|uniref:adenylyl-sulfate kinase n=1 Tax=Thermodesulfobacterium hveragerdense TaxID=53424 RepID=UPI0004256A6D|nr:adenylyl-sulfate kinase [Thermodesulfobacterium hveragerdense]
MSAYFKENKGVCVWFTGLPCAGKTTISKRLYEVLVRGNFKVRLFDGDEVRKTISKDLGFSREDRRENVLRVAKIAKDLVDQGYIVIWTLVKRIVSPYKISLQTFASIRIKQT